MTIGTTNIEQALKISGSVFGDWEIPTTNYQLECLREFVEYLDFELIEGLNGVYHIIDIIGNGASSPLTQYMSLQDAIDLHNISNFKDAHLCRLMNKYEITVRDLDYFNNHIKRVEILKLQRSKGRVTVTNNFVKFLNN